MSRENKFQAIILKKQDYSETDQIVTLFSLQKGKLRALVKAGKLQTSKLQTGTQPGFEINTTLTNSPSLPKLIQTEVISAPAHLYESMELQKIWFSSAELVFRAAPDEQPSEEIYYSLQGLLNFLESYSVNKFEQAEVLYLGLIKFQLLVMNNIGLGLQTLSEDIVADQLLFSAEKGGLLPPSAASSTAKLVPASFNKQLRWLQQVSFGQILQISSDKKLQVTGLQDIVNEFINYQLEREIKSHRFLRSGL